MKSISKLHRRTFLAGMGLLSLSRPLPTKGQQIQEPLEEHGFTTEPFLESLTTNGACISIIVNTKAFTWIEYGEQELDNKAYQILHGLKNANETLFKIRLKNLKPDTSYHYRVVSKPIIDFRSTRVQYGTEIYSQTYSFKTRATNPETCHALIFNDIHDNPSNITDVWNLKKNARQDLVIFNGDIFNQLKNEKQLVNNFFNPINKLFSTNTPIVFNRGNHETRGVFARQATSYFDNPNDKTYKAFRHGPIYWIFLDSGEDKVDSDKEYAGLANFDELRIEQRDWLLEVVKSKEFRNAPFKVVVMHIPPIHSGNWHGPLHCRELFLPVFNKYGIDMVLSGHTHKTVVHKPSVEQKFALFIGGGPKIGNRTIIELFADNKSLSARIISDAGIEIGNWSRTK